MTSNVKAVSGLNEQRQADTRPPAAHSPWGGNGASGGVAGREVRVVGTQDVYTIQGEWRGYLVLFNLRTGTTYNESPGRVYDADTGEWFSSWAV